MEISQDAKVSIPTLQKKDFWLAGLYHLLNRVLPRAQSSLASSKHCIAGPVLLQTKVQCIRHKQDFQQCIRCFPSKFCSSLTMCHLQVQGMHVSDQLAKIIKTGFEFPADASRRALVEIFRQRTKENIKCYSAFIPEFGMQVRHLISSLVHEKGKAP